jgi:hypothetical protein
MVNWKSVEVELLCAMLYRKMIIFLLGVFSYVIGFPLKSTLIFAHAGGLSSRAGTPSREPWLCAEASLTLFTFVFAQIVP